MGSSHTGAVGSGRNQDSAVLTVWLRPPLATCLGAPPVGVGGSLPAHLLPRPDSGVVRGPAPPPGAPAFLQWAPYSPRPRQGCVDKVSSSGVSGLTGLSLLSILQIPLSKRPAPASGGATTPPPRICADLWSPPRHCAPCQSPASLGICLCGCRRPPRAPLCPPSSWSPCAVAPLPLCCAQGLWTPCPTLSPRAEERP